MGICRRTAGKDNEPAMTISALARGYDHLVLDLDGCVWVGDSPTPRAVDAVAALRAAGKGVAFLADDARESAEDVVRRLWSLGFTAAVRDVVTVGGALQHWLAEQHSGDTAFVVGSAAIHRHVADAGLHVLNATDLAARADVVVLAWHERFDYAELRTATQAAARGARVVAAGGDGSFPMPEGRWPGTGAIVAALETAAGVDAHVLGKPDAGIFATALDRLGSGRALVVGDRLESDLCGARAAGLDAAIVLTGATSREEAESAQEPAPVAVAASLGELVLDGVPRLVPASD